MKIRIKLKLLQTTASCDKHVRWGQNWHKWLYSSSVLCYVCQKNTLIKVLLEAPRRPWQMSANDN